jgi:thiol:disulfide interchange protein DsbA
MAGNNDAALKTADYIITNIRADKAKAAAPAKK